MTKVTHLTLDERGALSRKRIHLREISGDADTPLETVGQDLRAARLRRGDDLASVSRALKIRKDHLEALEEDRVEALPGRAYAVGFIRSYADYLGLDPLQCVERFKAEIAGRSDAQPTVGPPPDADAMRLPQGWVVIGVVVLILIVYVAYHLARSADTLLRQQVAAVPTRMASPPPSMMASRRGHSTRPVAAAPGATSPGVTRAPATNAGPPLPATAATTPAPAAVAQGAPAAPKPATAVAQAPATAISYPLQPAAPSPTVAPPLPNGHVYGVQNRNVRVVLRARTVARVLVQAGDGSVLFNRILQPGDAYDVPNKVGLTLTTPNGGAIAVELDGQLMGYAARGSQMTEALSLDPQAIVDRYNRAKSG